MTPESDDRAPLIALRDHVGAHPHPLDLLTAIFHISDDTESVLQTLVEIL